MSAPNLWIVFWRSSEARYIPRTLSQFGTYRIKRAVNMIWGSVSIASCNLDRIYFIFYAVCGMERWGCGYGMPAMLSRSHNSTSKHLSECQYSSEGDCFLLLSECKTWATGTWNWRGSVQPSARTTSERGIFLRTCIVATWYRVFCTTFVHFGVVSKVHETFYRAMTTALSDFSDCWNHSYKQCFSDERQITFSGIKTQRTASPWRRKILTKFKGYTMKAH